MVSGYHDRVSRLKMQYLFSVDQTWVNMFLNSDVCIAKVFGHVRYVKFKNNFVYSILYINFYIDYFPMFFNS